MDADLILLYASSNGDRWFLGEGVEPRRRYVIHRANEPSGGAVTRIELDEFLARDQGAPEHQALVHLLQTATEET